MSSLPISYFVGSKPAFDPSVLAATMWQRGSVVLPIWPGTASAGTSGDTEERTTPVAGPALNALTSCAYGAGLATQTVCFKTSTVTSLKIGQALSLAAYTVMGLAFFHNAPPHQANAYENGCILGSSDGWFTLSFSDAGIELGTFNGANFNSKLAVACSTGAWHKFCARYAAGAMQIDVDAAIGAPSIQLPMPSFEATAVLQTRTTANTTQALTFDLMERMVLPSAVTDVQRDGYFSYLATRYGV